MSTISFDISMSLDGYVTGPHPTPEEPLGQQGERLHEWAFGSDEVNRTYLETATSDLGAVITGRVNFEDSLPWWGADGPTGERRLPVFVVGSRRPGNVPKDGVYTFVTDGIEAALESARAAAGSRDVTIMGGAGIGQSYLDAGLVDQVSIHLVPVLLGGGLRMFDWFPKTPRALELMDTVHTAAAVHLRYRTVPDER
jgi:dihydrofolate reductase